MKTLVSISNQTHYGKQRKVGEEFRATNADAEMLVAVGFAREQTAQPSKRAYRRRDMFAENSIIELDPKEPSES